MSNARRVELICGLLTGVVACIAPFAAMNLEPPDQFLIALFLYILPALLVAVGAGLHIIGFIRAGPIILNASGLIVVLPKVLGILGAFYGLSLWSGLFLLLPGLLAIVTMIACRISRNDPISD